MWPTRDFTLIGFLLPLVLGTPVEVNLRDIKGTNIKYEMTTIFGYEENDGGKPTFVGSVEPPEDKTGLSIEELYPFVSGAFNWLVETQQRHRYETDWGHCLVAALWIPEDHRVYFATKAKGKNFHIMNGEKVEGLPPLQRNTWAPVWSSRAIKKDDSSLIRNDVFHAEDTVYYYFERQRNYKNPLWERPMNGKKQWTFALTNSDTEPQAARDVTYPRGAKVVTWGYHHGVSEKTRKEGYPIEACGPNNKRLGHRESCQTVADDLGVEWASIKKLPPPQIEANNNMEMGERYSSNQTGCVAGSATRKRYETRQGSCSPMREFIEGITLDKMPEPKDIGGEGDNDDSCEEDAECLPTMCAGGGPGGGGTATCKDNKCTCEVASPPPDNSCESTEDCEDLECNDKMERVCVDGECLCKEPRSQESPTPTPAPKVPECFMQNALPDQYTSPFCNCNLGGETKTLPLLTVENPKVDTESCHYKTMPTGTENPVTEVTVTYTIDCEVCAGVGGVQNHDPEWCEPIEGCVPPRPTYALYISDTSLSVGTAFNEDEGVEIGQTLVDKLRDACPDDEDTCDTASFGVADVPLVVGEGVEYMALEANVDDSYYNSTSSRDYMIYGAVSGMVEGTRDSCEEVTYKDTADVGESGCGDGPIPEKRTPSPPEVYWDEETGERQLRKRIPPTDPDGTADDMVCTYSTNMCAGPKVITAILGTQEDPYLNNLGIRFALKKKDTGIDDPIGEFFCEAIVNALALAAMKYAPKLAGFEGVGEIEDMALEAICGSD